MRVFPLAVLIVAGFVASSSALPAKPRTCRVVFPERPPDAPKSAYLFDGKESRRTGLPSMNLAPVIELPSGELTIAMTSQDVDDPEELAPQAPRLKIPESAGDCYIVVTPDPENEYLPIKMELVDPEASKLEQGGMLWFNRTDHRIIARLGDSKVSIEPQSQSICRSPVIESGHYSAEFEYQANGEGPKVRITEQRWWHDIESRHLGFIVNTGDKLPKIFFFRDFRVPGQGGDGAAE